jgi:hypothetical protein
LNNIEVWSPPVALTKNFVRLYARCRKAICAEAQDADVLNVNATFECLPFAPVKPGPFDLVSRQSACVIVQELGAPESVVAIKDDCYGFAGHWRKDSISKACQSSAHKKGPLLRALVACLPGHRCPLFSLEHFENQLPDPWSAPLVWMLSARKRPAFSPGLLASVRTMPVGFLSDYWVA